MSTDARPVEPSPVDTVIDRLARDRVSRTDRGRLGEALGKADARADGQKAGPGEAFAPEWTAWGHGWRLKGTNWTIRLIGWPESWVVFCGQEYLDECLNLDEAKINAIQIRRRMDKEPTP